MAEIDPRSLTLTLDQFYEEIRTVMDYTIEGTPDWRKGFWAGLERLKERLDFMYLGIDEGDD